MSLSVHDFVKLKNKVTDLQQEVSRSDGAVEELCQQLQAKYDYSSIEEAKLRMADISKKLAKLQREFDELQSELDAKLKDHT